MTQTWRDKEIKPNIKYDDHQMREWNNEWASLPVLINRCQNLVISKHYWSNVEAPDSSKLDPFEIIEYYQKNPIKSPPDKVDVKVYMCQKMFDFFVNISTFDYKDHFIIEIDETVQDDMIIVSTLDQKYIEAVKIV